MVKSSGFAPLGILLVGLLIGWMAGRTVPWPTTQGETKVMTEPKAPVASTVSTVGERPRTDSQPSAAVPPRPLSIVDGLRTMKIVEIRKVCEEAENQFIEQKISGYAAALDELANNERDQELGVLRRQFATALEQSAYWRMDFSVEAGSDVVYGEMVIDLEGNSDVDFKCVAWSFYYELNGQVQRTSLFGASACEGSGIRKRNGHYYLDLSTYNFAEIGKRVTAILIPVPPSMEPLEVLRADSENWQSLGARPWTRITRADYLAWQRRISEKMGAHP